MKTKREVIRSCGWCKKRNDKSKFLRFVRAPDGLLCFDVKGLMQSRGVYTCKKIECVRNAYEKKRFARAFRLPILVEIVQLEERLSHFGIWSATEKLGNVNE